LQVPLNACLGLPFCRHLPFCLHRFACRSFPFCHCLCLLRFCRFTVIAPLDFCCRSTCGFACRSALCVLFCVLCTFYLVYCFCLSAFTSFCSFCRSTRISLVCGYVCLFGIILPGYVTVLPACCLLCLGSGIACRFCLRYTCRFHLPFLPQSAVRLDFTCVSVLHRFCVHLWEVEVPAACRFVLPFSAVFVRSFLRFRFVSFRFISFLIRFVCVFVLSRCSCSCLSTVSFSAVFSLRSGLY